MLRRVVCIRSRSFARPSAGDGPDSHGNCCYQLDASTPKPHGTGPIDRSMAQVGALRRATGSMKEVAAPVGPADADSAPELPLELVRRIVLDSLQSHGGDLAQWLRLSLVCKSWRSILLGEPSWL